MLSSHDRQQGEVTYLVVLEEASLTEETQARTGMFTSGVRGRYLGHFFFFRRNVFELVYRRSHQQCHQLMLQR